MSSLLLPCILKAQRAFQTFAAYAGTCKGCCSWYLAPGLSEVVQHSGRLPNSKLRRNSIHIPAIAAGAQRQLSRLLSVSTVSSLLHFGVCKCNVRALGSAESDDIHPLRLFAWHTETRVGVHPRVSSLRLFWELLDAGSSSFASLYPDTGPFFPHANAFFGHISYVLFSVRLLTMINKKRNCGGSSYETIISVYVGWMALIIMPWRDDNKETKVSVVLIMTYKRTGGCLVNIIYI